MHGLELRFFAREGELRERIFEAKWRGAKLRRGRELELPTV